MAGVGLLTGQVWTLSGKAARSATVTVTRVTGDLERWRVLPHGKQPSTTTDASGRFALPFQWMGSDLASGCQNIEVQMCAAVESVSIRGNTTTGESRGFVRARTRLYMIPNPTYAVGIAAADLQSFPGLLQYSLNIIWALNKFKANLPMVNFSHAESFLLLGALDITLTE